MTKRIMLACGLALALAACSKPSEGECKRAIANIRALMGTDRLTEDTGQTAAWVRSSTKTWPATSKNGWPICTRCVCRRAVKQTPRRTSRLNASSSKAQSFA